jgi:hypothetical protein
VRRAFFACAFATLVLAGCGVDEQETVDTGLGFDVEFDTSGSEDEQFHSFIEAVYDRLDLDEEFKACALDQVAEIDFVEAEAVSALSDMERARRVFQLQKQVSRACVESGDNLIATNADEVTLGVFRRSARDTAEFFLNKPPAVPKAYAACFLRELDSLTDAEFIKYVNGTYGEQEQLGVELGRRCQGQA